MKISKILTKEFIELKDEGAQFSKLSNPNQMISIHKSSSKTKNKKPSEKGANPGALLIREAVIESQKKRPKVGAPTKETQSNPAKATKSVKPGQRGSSSIASSTAKVGNLAKEKIALSTQAGKGKISKTKHSLKSRDISNLNSKASKKEKSVAKVGQLFQNHIASESPVRKTMQKR